MAKSLKKLREKILRLEEGHSCEKTAAVGLGHPAADAALKNGLLSGVLHEVFTAERHASTGTAFAFALALRLVQQKNFLWVRQDFSSALCGELSPLGLLELGLDPKRLLFVTAPGANSALRAASDSLSCKALGAIVLELYGETNFFDLTASRRFTLSAAHFGVSLIMLRIAAEPRPSTAETRWFVEPEPSYKENWGSPIFSTALVRNRHGGTGRFSMEWNCDECIFHESAHSRIVAAKTSYRSASSLRAETRIKRTG